MRAASRSAPLRPAIQPCQSFHHDPSCLTAEAWQAAAVKHDGSWWNDWQGWIAGRNGAERLAARIPGAGGLKAIEEAPWSYVRLRGGAKEAERRPPSGAG